MKTLEDITQGSDQWLAIRRQHFCASEAAACMGYDKNTSRSELLRMKATGFEREFSDWVQKNLLDKGHEIEAAARGTAEWIIGEDVYPCTGTLEVDGLRLLASFDGIVMDESVIWECKSRNADLLKALESGDLPDSNWPQLEQQLLISGAGRALFTPTDGTREGTVEFWYVSRPERRAQVIASWKQFAADLANYQPVEVLPPVTAAPVMALPALSIQVNGAISLVDNLAVFGEKLTAFIECINKNPSTDQAFADCEQAVKVLQTAQEALEAAEASALAQTATIDQMRRTVALYVDQARSTRLMLTKLVASRKEQIRVEIVTDGRNKLVQHVQTLNKRLGKPLMPVIPEEFAGVIKGKKTVASLKDACDTELARCKIAANEVADRIQINLASLIDLATEHKFLFADAAQLVLKDNDDLVNLIKLRIAEHAVAENKRLEVEREKIRAEEAEKLRAREVPATQTETISLPVDRGVDAITTHVVATAPLLNYETAIKDFLNTRKEPQKKINEMRATLVEFVKFLQNRGERMAA